MKNSNIGSTITIRIIITSTMLFLILPAFTPFLYPQDQLINTDSYEINDQDRTESVEHRA